MEKKYRITLDVNVKVNEKVKTKVKMEPTNKGYIQDYLDYLMTHPSEHSEFHKVRFLWGTVYKSQYDNSEVKRRLKIVNDDQNYQHVAANLPANAENYIKSFFGYSTYLSHEEDVKVCREFRVFLDQFGDYKIIKAVIEDISETD